MKSFPVLLFSAATLLLSSCDAVYEDLNPCPQGADINLTFTKHMLSKYNKTNAFDGAVHCAHIHLYSDEGNFLGTFSTNNTSSVSLDLAPGNYHAVAVGGMECDERSFIYHESMGQAHSLQDFSISLAPSRASLPTESSERLHPLFHGMADFSVSAEDTERRQVTVDLTKNTNNIRIVLQHEDASPVDPSKFLFYVDADNGVTDHKNDVILQNSDIKYTPWVKDTFTTGFLTDGRQVECAFAEIATPRLTAGSKAKLHVKLKDNGDDVVNIPLVYYLNMLKSYEWDRLPLEDYLDYQDSWSLVFMLDPKTEKIASMSFKVNDWILNLSNTGMEF